MAIHCLHLREACMCCVVIDSVFVSRLPGSSSSSSFRHSFHVYHRRTDSHEGLPKQTPRYPCQCLHSLLLICCGHFFFTLFGIVSECVCACMCVCMHVYMCACVCMCVSVCVVCECDHFHKFSYSTPTDRTLSQFGSPSVQSS